MRTELFYPVKSSLSEIIRNLLLKVLASTLLAFPTEIALNWTMIKLHQDFRFSYWLSAFLVYVVLSSSPPIIHIFQYRRSCHDRYLSNRFRNL